MPSKHPTCDSKGLTLIECVISILILSVTIMGGLMLYSHANAIMSKAMHKKIALEMAIQEMEKMKGAGYAGLPLTFPVGDWESLPDKTVAAQTSQPFTAQVRRRITETQANMKKVELDVKIEADAPWTEDDGDSRTIKLQTLVSL